MNPPSFFLVVKIINRSYLMTDSKKYATREEAIKAIENQIIEVSLRNEVPYLRSVLEVKA